MKDLMSPFVDFSYEYDHTDQRVACVATFDVREIVTITVEIPADDAPKARGIIVLRNGRDVPAWASSEAWSALRRSWVSPR